LYSSVFEFGKEAETITEFGKKGSVKLGWKKVRLLLNLERGRGVKAEVEKKLRLQLSLQRKLSGDKEINI